MPIMPYDHPDDDPAEQDDLMMYFVELGDDVMKSWTSKDNMEFTHEKALDAMSTLIMKMGGYDRPQTYAQFWHIVISCLLAAFQMGYAAGRVDSKLKEKEAKSK